MKKSITLIFALLFASLIFMPLISADTLPIVWWENKTESRITAVDISPEGDFIAVGTYKSESGGIVYFIDKNKNVVWTYNAGRKEIRKIAVASGGNYIAVGSSSSFFLLDKGGKLLWEYPIGWTASSIDISPTGEYIVASSGEDIYLFDYIGGIIWKRQTDGYINEARISSDGNRIIAASSDLNIYIWNSIGSLVAKYKFKDSFDSIDISRTGDYIAAASRGSKLIYLVNFSGDVLWKKELSGISGVSISKSGLEIVAKSDEGIIYFLDSNGNLLWKYNTYETVADAAITDDGKYMAVGGAKVYYLQSKGDITEREKSRQPSVTITSPQSYEIFDEVTISASVAAFYKTEVFVRIDDKVVSNTLPYIWDTTPASEGNHTITVEVLDSNKNRASDSNLVYVRKPILLWSFFIEDEGEVISVSDNGDHVVVGSRAAYLFDQKGKLIQKYAPGFNVKGAHVYSNGTVAFGSNDGVVHFYQGGTENKKQTMEVRSIFALSFAGNGYYACSYDLGGYIYVSLFDDKGGKLWSKKAIKPTTVVGISSGNFVVTTNVETGQKEKKYVYARGEWTEVYEDVYCKKAICLFSSSGDFVWSYEVTSEVTDAYISSDSSYIAVGTEDGKIYFLDSSQRLLWKQDIGSPVKSISLSGNGDYAVASVGRYVYFFNKEGTLLWKYRLGDKTLESVSLSSDGRYLGAVSGRDIFFLDNTKSVKFIESVVVPQIQEIKIMEVAGANSPNALADVETANIIKNSLERRLASVSRASEGETVKIIIKKDSEITSSDKSDFNLVLIGGPYANTLVRELVDKGKSKINWNDSNGDIEILRGAFQTGKNAIIVGGKNELATKAAALKMVSELDPSYVDYPRLSLDDIKAVPATIPPQITKASQETQAPAETSAPSKGICGPTVIVLMAVSCSTAYTISRKRSYINSFKKRR